MDTCTGADPGFGQGGPQLWRPKVANVAEWRHASYLQLGSRACLRALEAFEVLMVKYASCHILETLFPLISDMYIKTKNLQFLLIEKLYAEQSEAAKFLSFN